MPRIRADAPQTERPLVLHVPQGCSNRAPRERLCSVCCRTAKAVAGRKITPVMHPATFEARLIPTAHPICCLSVCSDRRQCGESLSRKPSKLGISDDAAMSSSSAPPEPAEASTSHSTDSPPRNRGYVIGQSITDRFKYEAVPHMTAMDIAQQDAAQNNCVVRAVLACVAGGVMGVGFGVLMGAMDPASVGNPAPLAEQKQKTAMQVLRSTLRTTRARSVCAVPDGLFS
jgi:hypothetical protein